MKFALNVPAENILQPEDLFIDDAGLDDSDH